MALVAGAFPYDIENLLGGRVRILYALPAEPVPASINDVILMESPYTAQTGWTDLGATRDSFTYTRGFDVEGWEIQQVPGNVIEEVTEITRTIEVSFADLRPEHLAMIEGQTAAPGNVTAVAGASAQKVVKFGSFSSLERRRFAFIAQRPLAAGIVVESGPAIERGRFFMGVAYQAQLSADEAELEQDKGALTAAGVTFTMFPDTDEVQGDEYGAWFDETAGTIT
jgi:hypothetical protein